MIRALLLLTFFLALSAHGYAQGYITDLARESARSDKITGGRIEKAALIPGDADLKITINIPAFQMTLWQSGREIRTYPIGVGMAEFPVMIGRMRASVVEWNPVWIPPSSDWIEKSVKVKAGEIILPTDPRNPLGKVKIPLGYGYLIHQARGQTDMGSLVSHGCIRVLQKDLYDLAEKIMAAQALDITPVQIAAAKRTKKTLTAELPSPLPVEITYDTIVVEAGKLHIYPDVYNHKRNTVEGVRRELKSSGIDDRGLTDTQIKKILAGVSGKKQFVVSVPDGGSRLALRNGQFVPVVGSAAAIAKPKARLSSANRRRG